MKVLSALSLFLLSVASLSFADTEVAQHDKQSSDSLDLDKFTSEEAALTIVAFLQGIIHVGYNEDKLGTIAEILQKFRESPETVNVTLVAAQNIYNADGSLEEIRTIELAIPTITSKQWFDLEFNEDNDEEWESDDYEKMREARDMIEALSILGVDMDLSYVEQDRHGNVKNEFYIDNNIMVANVDGMYYMNKTIYMDTIQDVEADYTQYISHDSVMPTSYLVYNDEGKFLKSKSHVVPELLAYVESESGEPSGDVVKVVHAMLADTYLETENTDNVPENLRRALETRYPDVIFSVVSGAPDGDYISKDFSIHMTYEFVDLKDSESYTVYGYNKTLHSA